MNEETARTQRVLVVDDNHDAADTLATLLELLGCDVRAAYDGRSAIQAVATWKPEVVLLDIGMPGMDGYEVARELRQEENGKALLLVAVTGWGQEEDLERTRAAGFDRHLTKPVDTDGLKALLVSLGRER